MSAASEAFRQATMLTKLRQVRMDVAARELARARAATATAEAARREADAATVDADAAHRTAKDRLGADLSEAERLLALVDQARFRQAVATQQLDAAQEQEQAHQRAEAEHRRAAIIARARHTGVEERAAALSRRMSRRREERAQSDAEDRRRRP